MMYQFINPYNFIPLGSGKTVCSSNSDEEKLTGYIACELETKTPLIMVDTSKQSEEEVLYDEKKIKHKVYNETLVIDGIPMIPASELRGMIRSKFEALTNSCMSSLEENLEFYSRYKGDMTELGILDLSDKEHAKLYRCEKTKIKKNEEYKYKKFKTGDLIPQNLIPKDFVPKNSISKERKEVYLRRGRKFANKQALHLYIITGELVEAKNKKDFACMYDEIIKLYTEHLSKEENKKHDALIEGNKHLVWYELKDENVYFSLGQNGQTKSKKTLKDLVPNGYCPCDRGEELCECCQIFGTIKDDLIKHSKVRVEDAYMKDMHQDYYKTTKPIVLDELSSPKYTNPMFYMKLKEDRRPVNEGQAKYSWGVDFCSVFNTKKKRYEIQDMNQNEIYIRGRKEYWHHNPTIQQAEKTERNCSVRPLKKGLTYTFKVYFEDLTKKQLEDLQLAISLGDSKKPNADYCHKLGLGKPLGYGSVKIKIKEIKLRKLDKDWTYKLEEYIPENHYIEDHFNKLEEDIKKSMLHMYDFNFIKKKGVKVDYPRNKKNDHIYEWFTNHKKTILPFSENEYDKLIQEGKTKKK